MSTPEILFEEKGGIGFVTLNRPQALNALSTDMCFKLDQKLQLWEKDNNINVIVIKGEGGKAFCAGGDVRKVVEYGLDNNNEAVRFFATEYKLNARIFHFPKPFIALMDGITMGGGVGVSIHGSHRIVTEKTLFAMPEAAIGFFPDVGASYFLSRMPGSIGLYLGLTGVRLKGSDVLYAGIGTAYMNSDKLDHFVDILINEKAKTNDDVDKVVAQFAEDPGAAPLDEYRDLIDAAFSENTIEDIFDHLGNIDHDWARETLAVLKKLSPMSLKVIIEELANGSKMSFDDCMIMEYRIASALTSYESDFYEGVRAVLIDKDHNPNWIPSTIEEVTTEMVMAHFDMPKSGDLFF